MIFASLRTVFLTTTASPPNFLLVLFYIIFHLLLHYNSRACLLYHYSDRNTNFKKNLRKNIFRIISMSSLSPFLILPVGLPGSGKSLIGDILFSHCTGMRSSLNVPLAMTRLSDMASLPWLRHPEFQAHFHKVFGEPGTNEKQEKGKWTRVCPDMMENESKFSKIDPLPMVMQELKKGNNVYVDKCNVSRKSRWRIFQMLKQNGLEPNQNFRAICFLFTDSRQFCERNVIARKHHPTLPGDDPVLARKVISHFSTCYNSLGKDEPFAEIVIGKKEMLRFISQL